MASKVNKTGVSYTPLKVFEAFAGIGAQKKAISVLSNGEKFKVIGTSEWDASAIISYALIHNFRSFQKILSKAVKMNESELDAYLSKFTFSLNSKKPGNVLNKQRKFKEALYSANKANKNHPNIKEVGAKELKNVDLLTYSFPCQGLSIANMGRGKGISQTVESTSNLIWEIRRILREVKENGKKLPTFLLMENVKELIGYKHIDDFNTWLDELSELGYVTSYCVLNGFHHGWIQKRARVFALSWLRSDYPNLDKNTLPKMSVMYSRTLSFEERKNIYREIFTSSEEHQEEIDESTPKDTPSRWRMAKNNRELFVEKDESHRKDGWTVRTLTTKQDRHPNLGMIKLKGEIKKGKLPYRFITPREGFLIMGFENEDFDRVRWAQREGLVNAEKLYRQAGNSILVPVITDIFKGIWKIHKGGGK